MVFIPQGQGYKGRKIRVTWKGEVIPGMRERTISFAGEPVDLTSDDDDGWRRLAHENGPAQKNVDVSFSGVIKSDTLKEDWISGDISGELIVDYPTGNRLSGTFMLANYTDTGPINDAATFEAQFQNSGPVTFDYVGS